MTTKARNNRKAIKNTNTAQEENVTTDNTINVDMETTMIEPIVREEDFPEPSTKLQRLMNSYMQKNNIPAQQTAQEDPLKNVKINVGTKKFEDLNKASQQKVLSRVNGVDYTKPVDIQTFGSAKQSPMTKHAELIISKYKASEVGELSEPITDLVATLKSNNPKEIVKKAKVKNDPDKELGVFASFREILSMKKSRKKMWKALAERETIMKNIRTIENELIKQQLNLRKDVAIYQEMGKATVKQVNEFEYDIIALQLMKDEAEERLNAMISEGELDLMEMNHANILKYAMDRISRKIYSMQTIRVSTVQTIPQIQVLINGDEIICEKIDEISSLIIPLWTWQYAIAIGAIKQQEALSIQKTIRSITSTLLTGNAKMLHDNMIAAQEELYAAAVAIEDLMEVQDYIDDMVTQVNRSRKEAAKKTLEGIEKMNVIEQKNYKLLSQNIEVSDELFTE